jgi:hypothetical protein
MFLRVSERLRRVGLIVLTDAGRIERFSGPTSRYPQRLRRSQLDPVGD